jgi:hypothetical protein
MVTSTSALCRLRDHLHLSLRSCMVLQHRLSAAALADAQAALQRLLLLQHVADQGEALVAPSDCQVLQCSFPDGAVERAQEGLCD